MDLLFGLLVSVVLLTLASAPVAAGLGLWNWINQKRAGERPRWQPAAKAAAFPLILVPQLALGLIAYGVWCEARGADPGFGDFRRISLGDRYALTEIDASGDWVVARAASPGAVLISGVLRIATAPDAILGEGDSGGAFILDTRTDQLSRYPDVATAAARFAPLPQLKSPAAFYVEHAPALPKVGLVLFGVSLLPTCVFWYRRFVRVPRV